jgi:hypothetical protein
MRLLPLATAVLLLASCGIQQWPGKKHHDDPPPQQQKQQKTTDDGPAVERVPG